MKLRNPKSVLSAVISVTAVASMGFGFTQTANAAGIDEDSSTSYSVLSGSSSNISPRSFDPGHPQNPVKPHHFGPYKNAHDCAYALGDQSGSRNVARGCMRENSGGWYYWGWGAGERH